MIEANVPVMGQPGDIYKHEQPAISDDMSPEMAGYLKDHGATHAERVDGAVWTVHYEGRGIAEGRSDPRTTIESTPHAQQTFNAYGILNSVAAETGPAATKLRTAADTASGQTLERRHEAILAEVARDITQTATAGIEGTIEVRRAFPEPALDPAASGKVRTLAECWNLLPGSDIIVNLRVWRDTRDPAWYYGRMMAKRAADNGRGWEQHYTAAFRDLLRNDPTPDAAADALEAREWSSHWSGVIRSRARNAMAELEELAVRYRRQASE